MKPKFFLVLAAAVAAFAGSARAEVKIPDDCKTGDFFIGCQAYTFNRFSAFEAIEKTAAAGAKVIEFYPNQKLSKEEPTVKWGHDASDEVVAKVQKKLAEHKVKAVNYGVVAIPSNEEQARKIFAFAKKMGIRAITTESVSSMDVIEKLVREYDICVGFHNHPKRPKDPNYKVWDPNYILEVVKNRDARIGAAADTGHWQTTNLDPLESLRLLKGRLISVHLKDKEAMGPSHDVPYGTGVGKVGQILDELKAQGFQGNISIEYEYNWENNLPEVTKCIDFVRSHKSK